MTNTLLKEFRTIYFYRSPENPKVLPGSDLNDFVNWIDQHFIAKEEVSELNKFLGDRYISKKEVEKQEIMIRAQERADADQRLTEYKWQVLQAIGEDEDIGNVHQFYKNKKPITTSAYDYSGGQVNGKNYFRKELRAKLGLEKK